MNRTLRARVWGGFLVSLACVSVAACSSDSTEPTKSDLSDGCAINSDCVSPLVCAYKHCHNACETSRDCPTTQRCMASDRPFHVCQLPEETKCVHNSDCPTAQVCGVDGQCRDQCASDRDCVNEQVCTQGTCADPVELDAGKLPVVHDDAAAESSTPTGLPCSYNSDCPTAMICASGLCRYECNGDVDCKAGQICLEHACTTDFCGGADAGVQGGQSCSWDSDCPAPLACRAGTCACQCKADVDCPGGARCEGFRCVATVPDAGVEAAVDAGIPCSYTSDCPSPMLCKSGFCRDECIQDVDCAIGYHCLGHLCTKSFCGGIDPGFTGGQDCSYDSQCSPPLVCRGGMCSCDCIADVDCKSGLVCTGYRCTAVPDASADVSSDATDASDAKACAYNSECPAPMVCFGGTCRWECVGDVDCSSGQVCLGHKCTASFCGGADAGVQGGQACSYDSQCSPPLVCRAGICACACLSNADCGSGLACQNFTCVVPIVDAGVEETPPPPPSGTVEGFVVDATHYGKGVIPGATVSVPGGFSTKTDANGHFKLTGIPVGARVLVTVDGPTTFEHDQKGSYPTYWTSTQAVVSVRANETTQVFPQVQTWCTQVTYLDMSTGADVSNFGCSSYPATWYAELLLDAGGVVWAADGSPYAGDARVELFPLQAGYIADPDGGAMLDLSTLISLPGDLSGVTAGGTATPTESLGAIEVRLFDNASGAPLQVAPGHTATILVSPARVPQAGDAPSAWYYDTATGKWKEDGAVSVVNKTVYPSDLTLLQMQVSHLSWWSASQPVTARSCVKGVVRAGGVPLGAADVRALGEDWGGASPVTAAADGSFCADVKAAGSVRIEAAGFSGSRLSATVPFQSAPAAGASCGGSPANCLDVGYVDLAPITTACIAGKTMLNKYPVGSSTPIATPLAAPLSLIAAINTRTGYGTPATYVGQVTPGADGSYCADVPPADTSLTVYSDRYLLVDDVAPVCHQPGRFQFTNTSGTAAGASCGVDATACEPAADAIFDCTDLHFYLGS